MTTRARLLALLSLALLLSGCRIAVDVEVDVDRDGAGTLSVTLTSDAALQHAAEAAGADPLGAMVERIERQGGWRVDDRADEVDRARVVQIRTGFDGPEHFALRWQELTAALDAPEGRLLGPLGITVDEQADTVAVTGSLALVVSEVAAADLGTDVATLTQQVAENVGATVTIITPSTVLTTDGESSSEVSEEETGPATITWRAVAGEEVPIAVTAERGPAGLPALLVTAGLVAAALALIVGGILAQRRR